MNQDIKNKMAEIIAAAQAKTSVKTIATKTTISAAIDRMNAENAALKAEIEKTKITIEDIIKSDTQGILNDVPNTEEIELSTLTIGDLLGEDTEAIGLSTYEIVKYETERETPVYCTPCILVLPSKQPAKDVFLIDYNDVSFALIGEGTKAIRDQIKVMGGSWCKYLKCGQGWIFSKKHLATVKATFNL